MLDESRIISIENAEDAVNINNMPDEKMLLQVLYYTGARISEVVGTDVGVVLTPARIIIDKSMLHLINLKFKHYKKKCRSCKTNLKIDQNTCYCGSQDIEYIPKAIRWKNVMVPNELITSLLEYVALRNIQENEPIFPINRFKAYRIVKQAFKQIGIHGHPHQFRHAFIMKGMRAGADLKFLQLQAGHSTGAMLFEYLSVSSEQRKKEMEKMFPEAKKEEPKEPQEQPKDAVPQAQESPAVETPSS